MAPEIPERNGCHGKKMEKHRTNFGDFSGVWDSNSNNDNLWLYLYLNRSQQPPTTTIHG
jgi:hypothetical protein